MVQLFSLILLFSRIVLAASTAVSASEEKEEQCGQQVPPSLGYYKNQLLFPGMGGGAITVIDKAISKVNEQERDDFLAQYQSLINIIPSKLYITQTIK